MKKNGGCNKKSGGKPMSVVAQRIMKDLQIANSESNLERGSVLYDVVSLILSNRTNPELAEILEDLGVESLLEAAKRQLHKWQYNLSSATGFFDYFDEGTNTWSVARILNSDNKKNTSVTVTYRGFASKFDKKANLQVPPLSEGVRLDVRPLKTRVLPQAYFESLKKARSEASMVPVDMSISELEPSENKNSGSSEEGKVEQLDGSPEGGSKNSSKKGGNRSLGEEGDEEEVDENDWICAACFQFETKDGSQLLICEGPCKRSYHMSCLKTKKLPEGEWFCNDCRDGHHLCFACNTMGSDYDMMPEGVHKCAEKKCGKYYHIACLSAGRIPRASKSSKGHVEASCTTSRKSFIAPAIKEAVRGVQVVQLEGPSPTKSTIDMPVNDAIVEKGDGVVSTKTTALITQNVKSYNFKCPLHVCDNCSEFYSTSSMRDLKGQDYNVLFGCLVCPRAFHVNCIQPGSRFNSLCLLCPLHPDVALPSKDPVSSVTGNKSSAMIFDHLTLPDTNPNKDDAEENHYKLPMRIREDVQSSAAPREFKMITRLDYECMKGKSMPSNEDFRRDQDRDVCSCVLRCDENCINRIMKVECCGDAPLSDRDDKKVDNKKQINCALGPGCGNRCFEERDYAKIERFREHAMGFGGKASEFIPEGRLVIEYIGEVIDMEEMVSRMENQRKCHPNDHDFYIMELDGGIYVDGKHKGNASRFINHSCDPNCELERFLVKGKLRIGIFAKRDINPGEPLSYDYQFETKEEKAFRCFCGSEICRGTMAPKMHKDRTEISKQDRRFCIYLGRKRAHELENRVALPSVLWRRLNCTGSTLPGDPLLPVATGPHRQYHSDARRGMLFLPRNQMRGGLFWSRRQLMWEIASDRKFSNQTVSSRQTSRVTPNNKRGKPTVTLATRSSQRGAASNTSPDANRHVGRGRPKRSSNTDVSIEEVLMGEDGDMVDVGVIEAKRPREESEDVGPAKRVKGDEEINELL